MNISSIVAPQKGDLVLIQGTLINNTVHPYKVAEVKEVDGDLEIILDKRKNVWFSWNLYMNGNSWITDYKLITP